MSASRQHSPYSPAHRIRIIGFSGNVLSRSLLEPEGGQCTDTELSGLAKRTQPTQTSQQHRLSVTYPPPSFPFPCPLPMSSCPYFHVFHVLPRCTGCRTLNMDTRHTRHKAHKTHKTRCLDSLLSAGHIRRLCKPVHICPVAV